MNRMIISTEEYKELHRKAVAYDLLKKDYEKKKSHTPVEEVIFEEEEKQIKVDFLVLEGEKSNGN